jgi:hypothetical protein
MPVVTVTVDHLEGLGLLFDRLLRSTLDADAQRALEPLLASRGFDVTRTIHVVVLASGEGIILMQ